MLKKVSARKTFSKTENSFESQGCFSTTGMFRNDKQSQKKLNKGIFHNHSENYKTMIQKLWQCGQVDVRSYFEG